MQAIGQALGRDGRQALPARIAYEDVVIVEHGRPAALDSFQQGRLAAVMQQAEISLTVALNGPGAAATVYFSDLTHDYVTLNAEYST
jgi:glutamate N-acetyltransferase/amino-acid N-acetyltransferase